ncbi:MAG: septum formation initiator family protein [Guyparkeria sp.]|uniref:septum formation initiator family protein n=1 Tax=Guyparkeria sp. TaxID=2035736 RepID=UPI003978CF57
MRLLTVILVLMVAGLQWRVWFSEASVGEVRAKQERLEVLQAEQTRLERRNETLAAEVDSLREGVDAVEAQARLTLGLVREDEDFYQVVEGVRPDTITPPVVDPARVTAPSIDD